MAKTYAQQGSAFRYADRTVYTFGRVLTGGDRERLQMNPRLPDSPELPDKFFLILPGGDGPCHLAPGKITLQSEDVGVLRHVTKVLRRCGGSGDNFNVVEVRVAEGDFGPGDDVEVVVRRRRRADG